MRVSTITNNKDANTVAINNLAELQKLICTNTWSPAIFKGTRSNDNFMSTELLVLDVDNGASINDAFSVFSGYKIIIAPTRSHQVEKNGQKCDRFRVILFLQEPITSQEDFLATWQLAQSMLPSIDAACKDPARQYFASQYIAEVEDGALFPVIRAAPKRLVEKKLPTQKYPIPTYTKNFMDHGAQNGSWNGTMFKAAKLMQECGYSEEETISLFETMTNEFYTGALDNNDLKTISSAFNKPGKYDPKISWPDMIQNRHGDYIVNPHSHRNVEYFLTTISSIDIKRNLLRDSIEFDGVVLDDYGFASLKLSILDMGLKPSVELLQSIIYKVANNNKYHPFKNAVEKTPWDGKDHIGELYNQITIDGENLPIYKEYLRRWLIGVMARVYDPIGQQNNMLVLFGPQGVGKSRFLERFSIAPSMYSEGTIDPRNKDDILKTVFNVIFHLSELDSITRKKEASDLKSYLTSTSADVRAPYDRFSKKLIPVCSFVASVNEKTFLVDPTGNRRFLVVPVRGLNPNHKVDMQQVYAQALALYRAGERFYFDTSEIVEVNSLNEEYTIASKMDYLIDGLRPGNYEISSEELLNRIGYKDNRSFHDYSLLGQALHRLNIQKSRKTISNKKLTFYFIDESSLPKLM